MAKKSKKFKFNVILYGVFVCAVLMVVACFLPYLSFTSEVIVIGTSTETLTGSDYIADMFKDKGENAETPFETVCLYMGSFGSVVLAAGMIVLLLVAMLLGGGLGKLLVKITTLVALVAAIVSVMALIGGIMTTQNTSNNVSVGGYNLASYTVKLGFGLFLNLIGGVGSLAVAIIAKQK